MALSTIDNAGAVDLNASTHFGPFRDSNGNLYVIAHPLASSAVIDAFKSTDGGANWTKQDTANNPSAQSGTYYAISAVQDGTVIHIASHTSFPGGKTQNVRTDYHTFNTSDAGANPDTWQIVDEAVVTVNVGDAGDVTESAGIEIAVRSDGDVIVFHPGSAFTDMGTDFFNLAYSRREGGSWTTNTALFNEAGNQEPGKCVMAPNDECHFFYAGGTLSLNIVLHAATLDSGNNISTRISVGSRDGVTPGIARPIEWDNSGTQQIAILRADSGDEGMLVRRLTEDASGDIATEAGQGSANVKDNTTHVNTALNLGLARNPASGDVYAFFPSVDSDLYYDKSAEADDASWGTDVEQEDATTINGVWANYYNNTIGYVVLDASAQLKYGELAVSSTQVISVNTLAQTDSLIAIPAVKPITTAVGTLAETNTLIATPTYDGPKIVNVGAEYNTGGTDATTHSIPLPGSLVNGNALVVFLPYDGGGGASSADLTEIFDEQSGLGGSVGLWVGYRSIDGTEGATIDVTTGVAENAVGWAVQIENWDGQAPEVSTQANGTGQNADSPNFTPTGGTLDRIAISTFSINGGTASVSETPYADLNVDAGTGGSGSSGGGVSIGEISNASSYDPSPWTTSSSNEWLAITLTMEAPSGQTINVGTISEASGNRQYGYYEFDDGDYLYTSDKASLDLNDFEIIALVYADTYDVDLDRNVINKGSTSDYAYGFGLFGDGLGAVRLEVNYSFDGNRTADFGGNLVSAVTDGVPFWMRVTFDADDGASAFQVNFYYSNDHWTTDPGSVSWTFDANDTGVAGTLHTNNTQVQIGTHFNGPTETFIDGGILGVWVYNSHTGGTEVISADFRNATQGWDAPPGVDDQSNTWDESGPPTWVKPGGLVPIEAQLGAGQTVNAGTLAETDSLLAIAAVKPIITAVGTLAQADALLALTGTKTATVGTILETDSLLAASPLKAAVVGTLGETDTLITVQVVKPQDVSVNTLAELESLVAVSPFKTVTVGTLTELNNLIAIGAVKPIVASVGVLGQTDTLISVTGLKTAGVGTLSEVDSLIAVDAIKAIITPVGTLAELETLIAVQALKLATIGTISETDALIAIQALKPIVAPVGTLSEVGTLVAIQALKLASIGTISETEALIAIQALKPIIAAVGTLSQTDSLVPVDVSLGIAVGTLSETDALIAIEALKPIVQAVGTLSQLDALISVAGLKAVSVGTLSELDLLVVVEALKPIIQTVGTLAGTDILNAVQILKTYNIGTLAEIETLIAVQALKPILQVVGTLGQTDTLISVGGIKTAPIGTLAELNQLVAITGGTEQVVPINTLAEIETLVGIEALKPIIQAVGTMSELENLISVSGIKTVSIGTLAELDALVSVSGLKQATVGTISEVDSLVSVLAQKVATVGTLAESDVLVSVASLKTADVGTLAEIETLLNIAGIKTVHVGVLSETNNLIAIAVETPTGQDIAVGTLAEIDALVSIAGLHLVDVGTLSETEVLQAIQALKPIVTPVGTLVTTDLLIPTSPLKVATIGTLAEVDALVAIEALKPIFQTVGTLNELDTLIQISSLKGVGVGTLSELDSLLSIGGAKTAGIGTLSELDLLVAVEALKPILRNVGTLSESNSLVAAQAIIGALIRLVRRTSKKMYDTTRSSGEYDPTHSTRVGIKK